MQKYAAPDLPGVLGESRETEGFRGFPSFPDVLPVLVKSEKAWAEEDAQAKLASFCILSYPFTGSIFFIHY